MWDQTIITVRRQPGDEVLENLRIRQQDKVDQLAQLLALYMQDTVQKAEPKGCSKEERMATDPATDESKNGEDERVDDRDVLEHFHRATYRPPSEGGLVTAKHVCASRSWKSIRPDAARKACASTLKHKHDHKAFGVAWLAEVKLLAKVCSKRLQHMSGNAMKASSVAHQNAHGDRYDVFASTPATCSCDAGTDSQSENHQEQVHWTVRHYHGFRALCDRYTARAHSFIGPVPIGEEGC